ncbi:MAG: YDG domain-containing protein [Bacteroidales bacterium]
MLCFKSRPGNNKDLVHRCPGINFLPGIMIMVALFLHSTALLTAQDIIKAEYFFNSDPGFGAATDIPVATPAGRIDNLSFTADLSGLQDGFNTLFIRAMDENGKWSHTYMRPFYKADITTDPDPSNIVKAEYFFNSDPGFGAATDIPVSTPAGRVDNLSFTADVSGLQNGFNTLFVRAMDENGKWTHTYMRPFYKTDITTDPDPSNIVKAEYFFNSDPGFGAATEIAIASPAGRIDSLSFVADASSLSMGSHTIFVRAMDENGKWSFTCIEEFCRLPYTSFSAGEVVYGNPTLFAISSEQADESIVYHWDVDGDGENDYEGKDDFQHMYGSAGVYMARLVIGVPDECHDTIVKEVVVSPAELTLGGSFTVEEKEYDGTNVATIAENSLNLSGIIEDDDVNLGSIEVEFSRSTPGEDITVNIISAELTGNDRDNYLLSLEGAPTSTGDIYLYGDANCDGVVDVLDLTTLVNYFTGRNPEPFFIKNADVNHDGVINVLDFIGTVNIFFGTKSVKALSLHPEAAHLYLNNDGISLKSDGTLAGLQIELTGRLPGSLSLSPGLEDLNLLSTIADEKITVILFSTDNTPLPAGEIRLVAFDNEEARVDWGKVVAGNRDGESVPVIKHTFEDAASTGAGSATGFAAYPNPAGDILWVEFINEKNAQAIVSLLNMEGRVVDMRTVPRKGYSKIMFDLKDLYSGIYIVRLERGNIVINSKIIVKQE